jgi:hypothetical protein
MAFIHWLRMNNIKMLPFICKGLRSTGVYYHKTKVRNILDIYKNGTRIF